MLPDYEEKRMQRCIQASIDLLNAWKAGKVKITLNEQDPANSIYTLQSYLSVIESNLLEAVTPVDELIERGDGAYEVLSTI